MKIYFLLLFNHVILQSKIPVRRFENRKDFDDIELGIENWPNTNLKSMETMIRNLDLYLGLVHFGQLEPRIYCPRPQLSKVLNLIKILDLSSVENFST